MIPPVRQKESANPRMRLLWKMRVPLVFVCLVVPLIGLTVMLIGNALLPATVGAIVMAIGAIGTIAGCAIGLYSAFRIALNDPYWLSTMGLIAEPKENDISPADDEDQR